MSQGSHRQLLPPGDPSKEMRTQGSQTRLHDVLPLWKERTKAAHFRDVLEGREGRIVLPNRVRDPKR